jgi:hypothetical protein
MLLRQYDGKLLMHIELDDRKIVDKCMHFGRPSYIAYSHMNRRLRFGQPQGTLKMAGDRSSAADGAAAAAAARTITEAEAKALAEKMGRVTVELWSLCVETVI